nr:MAG: ORF1 [TTV-like mini virus]
MPYYQRKRWWRPYTTRRWRTQRRRRRQLYPRFWRLRSTLRRRKRYRVRRFKRKFKRKLKTLPLKQWQPQLIRRSKIKGYFTLFFSQKGTLSNNYPQYRDSIAPPFTPSGGGWGIYVFNLGALFDEFNRVRNWWTVSNVDLPLCRYTGCKFTLYRAEDVDYVFVYSTHYPMTDTEQRHADAQPSRLLLRKRKVIVESRKHKRGKPYINVRIRPPKQLINKWFFQRQFVNTNLLLATVSACSLTDFETNPQQLSSTITFLSLNYDIFKSLDFQRHNTTSFYGPKAGYYLYATDKQLSPLTDVSSQNLKYTDLIFLGQATRMVPGSKISGSFTDYFKNTDKFGNIFYNQYMEHNWTILVTNLQWTAFGSEINTTVKANTFTILSEPLYLTIQYNPIKDTGKDTICYFVPNFQNYNDWLRPENEQLFFHGYPLWMLLWGWPDWQKKLGLINQINDHYILVFENPFCIPKKAKYMPIDIEFIHNTVPYPDPDESNNEYNKPSLNQQQNWYPQFKYQQKAIDSICASGPATYKFKNNLAIEAHMKYCFYFKWGGSPTTNETIADPSKQAQYPVPDTITSTIQIQDPTTDPRSLLYSWDFRRHMLTQKATERITKNQIFDYSFPLSTDQWINPKAPETEKELLQTLIEAQTKKEEKEKNVQLYKQLRERQQLLNQQLQQLILSSIK